MDFTPDDLLTQRGRDKLQPRPRGDAYFRTIGRGQAIGYRPSKVKDQPGTWIARFRDRDTGKVRLVSIGEQQDYSKAVTAATAVFNQAVRGVEVSRRVTVKDACIAYLDRLTNRKLATRLETEPRFEQLVYFADGADKSEADADDPRRWFGDLELAKLRREHVDKWFCYVSKTRAPATANREFRRLRAAFNYAKRENLIADGSAWLIDVHAGAESARVDEALSRAEQKLLLDKNPETDKYFLPDLEMRVFCMMLAFTGLRPGAVAALKVKDFDPRKKQLAINKDKANGARKIIVSTRTAKLLEMRCKGRDANDLIFGLTVNGERRPWIKDLWKDRFSNGAKRCAKYYRGLAKRLRDEGDKVAAEEAEDSANRLQTATLYVLRHSCISEMIERGAAINVVAQLVGTSQEMIQRHYGHLSGQTGKLLDQIGF